MKNLWYKFLIATNYVYQRSVGVLHQYYRYVNTPRALFGNVGKWTSAVILAEARIHAFSNFPLDSRLLAFA